MEEITLLQNHFYVPYVVVHEVDLKVVVSRRPPLTVLHQVSDGPGGMFSKTRLTTLWRNPPQSRLLLGSPSKSSTQTVEWIEQWQQGKSLTSEFRRPSTSGSNPDKNSSYWPTKDLIGNLASCNWLLPGGASGT